MWCSLENEHTAGFIVKTSIDSLQMVSVLNHCYFNEISHFPIALLNFLRSEQRNNVSFYNNTILTLLAYTYTIFVLLK
jgi:hypothetical protein